ncbi:MAG: CARDB domain-containing protein, partial [Thermodesulfobacteriota bacterium]|nr:CARDB domain-containing protein [Thermodesulfobacteriota bacterium]
RPEPAKYNAASWAKINDTAQIKAALVNRKPVVVGIDTYAPLYDLQGANSVYNTISGQSRGGHAVTIVGYDDNKYGGAFKVINSWGVNFGDNGYFWMPYSFAPQVLMVAYVLEDADNSGVPDPVPTEPTHPVVDDSLLPNLTVQSWSINYDPRPRGIGTLHYSVVNSGQGIATQGAEVNLMLSRDRNINANDYFVVYEPIPFDLSSGATAYRDVTNAVSFQFPDQLQPGIYYMALWVDDRNVVAESNEGDNISLGDSQANIVSSFSDLKVDTWYTTWDASGHGELTYKVSNVGASATSSTHWDINLILDSDQIAGNGNEIFLFFESAGGILQPGEYFYRDQYRPASFSLRSDAWGQNVPAGEYYMALWVDDQNREEESNELNNASYSWGTVTLNAARSARSANASSLPDVSVGVGGSAHNGRTLPTENMLVRKVRIGRTAAGEVTVTFPGKKVATPEEQRAIAMKKGMVAQSKLIFPITERIPMPAVTASE